MTRSFTAVLGNSQRLDGGAMYGNAPRALWERWSPPDERHRIQLACRAMLVRDGDRLVLVETGIGAFFDPKSRDRYGVLEDRHVLLESLAAHGVSDADVDVVILSHLHFDHAGGLLSPWTPDSAPKLLFPRATFVVGDAAWGRAMNPHSRDRASFVPELNAQLEASGRLERLTGPTSAALGDGWRFRFSDGHTPGLTIAEVDLPGGPVVFASDLIPGVPWVHAPITMGYDRHPELLIDEKRALLDDLVGRGGRLFFTHDPAVAVGRVQRDANGKYGVTETSDAAGWCA